MRHTRFKNVFFEKRGEGRVILFTKNLTPGISFFDEKLVKEKDGEYRQWDASRSKLAAAILNSINEIGIKEGSIVLYLGASHGYTPSFVSDIVGEKGFIFAIDFAPRVVRDLVFMAEKRRNIAPMLADANHPERYKEDVTKVDIIYQDVAQKNQAEILLKNAEIFLKEGGYALIAVKSRSIDVTRKPKGIFNEVKDKLSRRLEIIDMKELEPFEKDHCFIVCRKKSIERFK